MPSPAPAWHCVDSASLAEASVEALDRLFLELFRRTAGGDIRPSPVSTLEIAEVERVVTRRHGPAIAGLLRAERTALTGPTLPPTTTWELHGVPTLEARASYVPGRDGQAATIRVPLQLRDPRAATLFTAAWRHAFGGAPGLADLPRVSERLKTKGPPFRCTNCGDTLPSEPEDARTCTRCLARLEPARALAATQWGPMRAELHEAGLHRVFSSFERTVDTEVAFDVGFEAVPEGGAVPPCAGVAIGTMTAARTVLLRPDGTFALACDRLVEGAEPGTYPRERVMAIDWTEHSALGRGVGERNRLRISVDHRGIRASVGDHLLFEQPPSAEDADAKCICLVAACDGRGTSVRFDRFGRAEAREDAPDSDDPTRVDRRAEPGGG